MSLYFYRSLTSAGSYAVLVTNTPQDTLSFWRLLSEKDAP